MGRPIRPRGAPFAPGTTPLTLGDPKAPEGLGNLKALGLPQRPWGGPFAPGAMPGTQGTGDGMGPGTGPAGCGSWPVGCFDQIWLWVQAGWAAFV